MGSLKIRGCLGHALGTYQTASTQQTQRRLASLKRCCRDYEEEQFPVPPSKQYRHRRPRPGAPGIAPRRQWQQARERGGGKEGDSGHSSEETVGNDYDDSEYKEVGSEKEESCEDGSSAPQSAPGNPPWEQGRSQIASLGGTGAGAGALISFAEKQDGEGMSERSSNAGGGESESPTSLSSRQHGQSGIPHSRVLAGRGGTSRGSSGGPGEYECLVCGKSFGKTCKLVRHAATHTGEKPFCCDEDGCTKAFATKDKLKRHALSHARRKAGLSVSVGSAARREAEVRERAAVFAENAVAAVVSLERPVPAADTRHLLPYTPTTAPLLEASRMEKERAVSRKGSGDGTGGGWKHSCPSCGRNFLDNYHLKRHIKAIHEGPRPYRCDHPVAVSSPTSPPSSAGPAAASPAIATTAIGCVGTVSDECTLRKDVGVVQEGEGEAEKGAGSTKAGQQGQLYRVCGAAFAKKWQLREHLNAEHGQTKFNSRQHRCPHPQCGREFDRPSKLAAHEKTHEARFVCEFKDCGAAFVLASGLNLHLKQKHPFRCGICGMVFDREDKMQIHEGTHGRAGDGDYIRPYHCNVLGCGKAFTEKRNLNAHRRTQHTEGGRKRFRCEAYGCTMAYAHRHTLVKHVKREHQSLASSGGVNVTERVTDGKIGDGAKQSAIMSHLGQGSGTAGASVESAPGAAGTLDPDKGR